jgi:hypothetical protein
MALLERMDVPTGLMATAVRMRLRLDDLDHSISAEMLDRFAAGAATRGERRTAVRHLLDGCLSCSRHLGSYLPMEPAKAWEDAYDQALERGLERALAAIGTGA